MARIGASSSFGRNLARVSLLNPNQALGLDGRNRSSCPTAVIIGGERKSLSGRTRPRFESERSKQCGPTAGKGRANVEEMARLIIQVGIASLVYIGKRQRHGWRV
jgi:hypothetical protein